MPKGTPEQIRAQRRRERRRKLDYVQEEKAGKPCARCGAHPAPCAMTFHHRDPSTKLFELNRPERRSYAQIDAEIAKCELLCANCHAQEHCREAA